MKRVILLILCICLILCGCGAAQETTNPTTTPTTEITIETSAPTQPTSTAEESTAPDAEEVSLEESVVFDNGDFKLTVKEIDFTDKYKVKIKFLAENNSDKNIVFSCDDFTVNGITIYGSMFIKVAAGKKANDYLEFRKETLEQYGIEQIATVQSHGAQIIDNDTYKDIVDFSIDLATSISDGYFQQIDNSGQTVYSQDGITIKYRGIVESWSGWEEFEFFIENATNTDVNIQVDNVSVNGFTVYGSMVAKAYSGCVTYETVGFLHSDLEDNDIEVIEEVSLTFLGYDSETYHTLWTSDEITIGRVPETSANNATDPTAEGTTEDSTVWTPELLAVLLESTFQQNFSYVDAQIDDDTATVLIGNDGYAATVIAGNFSDSQWQNLKESFVNVYDSILGVIEGPLGGRTFVLNFVDETNPDTVFLTVENGEITFDLLNQ